MLDSSGGGQVTGLSALGRQRWGANALQIGGNGDGDGGRLAVPGLSQGCLSHQTATNYLGSSSP